MGSADSYVEIWLEKDALAGVIYSVTSMYDVPLMVARGYASLSFLYTAADAINELAVPAYIYHLGISIRPVSMPVRRSKKPCASWHHTPTFISSASR